MKKYLVAINFLLLVTELVAQQNFDIFSYTPPTGFTLKQNKGYLFYEKMEGKNYCQLFLYPATTGTKDVAKDFADDWNFFARKPAQQVGDPETLEKDTTSKWHAIFGAARGVYAKKEFAITLTTYTKADITYYIAAVFTDKKFIPVAQDFMSGVLPDENKFVKNVNNKPPLQQENGNSSATTASSAITKSTTSFSDGWTGTITPGYVKLTKAGTELRLHYTDPALDDARPNTIDAPEYYWSKYVEPYFTVSNAEKWAGVQYPVIYHMQANAVEKQTGKHCFVAIKIVYNGGARPIVVIAPDQNSYNQQYPHPNDIDGMLQANRFAVTASDVIGTWKGGGGGGVEYYTAYSGTYAGMSAVSSTDEFTFYPDGSYSSTYRGASMNNNGTQFSGQDFKGQATVNDWSIVLTNRLGGKSTTYNAHLIAVKNGYLLYMADVDNPSMNYTLYKAK